MVVHFSLSLSPLVIFKVLKPMREKFYHTLAFLTPSHKFSLIFILRDLTSQFIYSMLMYFIIHEKKFISSYTSKIASSRCKNINISVLMHIYCQIHKEKSADHYSSSDNDQQAPLVFILPNDRENISCLWFSDGNLRTGTGLKKFLFCKFKCSGT